MRNALKPKASAGSRKVGAGQDEPDLWLGFLLSQAAWIIQRRATLALRPHALTPRALGFLLALRANEGASQVEVAKKVRMDRTTSSQLVEDLKESGWLERGVSSQDRRSDQLTLSDKGRAQLDAAEKDAAIAEADLLDLLPAEARSALKRSLKTLVEGQAAAVPADPTKTC